MEGGTTPFDTDWESRGGVLECENSCTTHTGSNVKNHRTGSLVTVTCLPEGTPDRVMVDVSRCLSKETFILPSRTRLWTCPYREGCSHTLSVGCQSSVSGMIFVPTPSLPVVPFPSYLEQGDLRPSRSGFRTGRVGSEPYVSRLFWSSCPCPGTRRSGPRRGPSRPTTVLSRPSTSVVKTLPDPGSQYTTTPGPFAGGRGLRR